MRIDQAERSIEAILFASGDPVEIQKICEVLEIDEKTVKNIIERIREQYLERQSPLDIMMLGESAQMCVLPQYSDVIRETLALKRHAALSQASLEVLAIIAYNQPVTRSFVEQVRGVDCTTIMRNLADKDLIEEAGRLPIPGKPISYRTTPNFLRCFGIESLEHLPAVPELEPEPSMDEPKDEQLEGQMDFFD